MSKYAAVIVTYFPDADAIENLKQVSGLCDTVVVIDNTPEKMMRRFPDLKNITVWKSAENVGLASALNIGMKLATKQGVENVFLFDQDSRPPHHYFQDMLNFKSRMNSNPHSYAFYVPNFYDRNSKTFATFPLLGRFSLRHVTCEGMPSLTDNLALIAITSGMLITVSAYKKIGPFRDDYLIDFIDNEYCLRANKLGYSIAVNCDLILDHAVGQRSVKKFHGLTIKPNHHAPIRRYYIFRNGIRTTIDYFYPYPCYAILMMARLTHEILSIVLYEESKYRKIRALILGIYHGLTGRMGKFQMT
ncbi:glycosyltransferase family 2 protein [Patescibacteria group bacterium]|nr:glycosyltransferase family 2 protein [Patescibacteria group bacterium]